MAEKIIFEGGHCRVVKEETIFESSSEAMLDQIVGKLPVKTKMMPRNCFYYERNSNNVGVYVVELTPKIWRIKYQGREEGTDNLKDINYRISMPFIYLAFQVMEQNNNITYVYPFCTKEPINSEKDKIYVAPMSNVYDTGNTHICLGTIRPTQTTVREKIDFMADSIMGVRWNQELTYQLPPELGSFEKWEKLSLENPLIWVSAKYALHKKKTFGDMINFAMTTRAGEN